MSPEGWVLATQLALGLSILSVLALGKTAAVPATDAEREVEEEADE